MPEKFLTSKQVQERTTLSRTEVFRRLESGDFPPPVRLGPKKNAWLEREVDAWINAKAEECR